MVRMANSIKEKLSDIHYVWLTELKAIFADQGVMIFFFLVPLIYPLLYAAFYNNEVVRDAKLVFVDEDNSRLSREYIRRIDATPDVEVVKILPTLEEANEMLRRKEAYGVVLISKDFSKDLTLRKQTNVTLFSDLSSVLYYKGFMVALNDVSLTMGRELTAAEDYGPSDLATAIKVRPVESEYVAYYNPQTGFESFLMPAILVLILQQTMSLGVCMLAGTARERNEKHYIIPPMMAHYGGPLRVMLGKSLAYIFVYVFNCIWILVLMPYFLSLPQLAASIDLILFFVPFLLASTFFALTLSLFVYRREDTMIYIVFTSVIFIFLVGLSWPLYAIPPFWKAFGYLIPSTPGGQGFSALNGMGATLTEVEVQYKTLWIQTAFYFIIAAFGYRRQYVKSNRSS